MFQVGNAGISKHHSDQRRFDNAAFHNGRWFASRFLRAHRCWCEQDCWEVSWSMAANAFTMTIRFPSDSSSKEICAILRIVRRRKRLLFLATDFQDAAHVAPGLEGSGAPPALKGSRIRIARTPPPEVVGIKYVVNALTYFRHS